MPGGASPCLRYGEGTWGHCGGGQQCLGVLLHAPGTAGGHGDIVRGPVVSGGAAPCPRYSRGTRGHCGGDTQSDKWLWCPQALCCADKVHCCPHATICDLAHGRCLSPTGDTPMGTAFPAWKRQPPPAGKGCPPPGAGVSLAVPTETTRQWGGGSVTLCVWVSPAVTLRQVLCPDGRSACPDGATCCQLSLGQYGCCPLQNVSAAPPKTTTLCGAAQTHHSVLGTQTNHSVLGTPNQAPQTGHPVLVTPKQPHCAGHPKTGSPLLRTPNQPPSTGHPTTGTS